MKLFTDCEIVRHHLRGHTAVVIVGARAATVDEGVALLAEFADSFGTTQRPMYFSKDGWQQLGKASKAKAAVQTPAPDTTPPAAEGALASAAGAGAAADDAAAPASTAAGSK